MASRICVVSKAHGRAPTPVSVYTIDAELSEARLKQIAEDLTNPTVETYAINALPKLKYTRLYEIGFLPGVTDNVGHTASEQFGVPIYYSKIYFESTDYNPLIERCIVGAKLSPLTVPKVTLPQKTPVLKVSLDVSDDELQKIGSEGVRSPSGERRGPLALDLMAMQTIQKHFTKLKRDPTDIELESLAQTWSEHCKHTIFGGPIDEIADGLYKTYIKGATNKIRKQKGTKDFCISVFSDNSGGIVFDKNFMISHKVETHNSPSALDPFGGAITGIGGVNRDAIGFAMGAKPVANTYGFCFGYPDDTRALFRDAALTQKMLSPKRIADGVIRGVNVGGNCAGIPTVHGFVRYDERFRGKPLVFVGTVGLIPRKIKGKMSHIKSARPGDYIVVVGGKVGADGIHGATFSSVVMDSSSPATAVQIGDPITQKMLSDVIVKEARDRGLYHSITDNGAGGLSCSVAEMAKEAGGAVVDIDAVPLKYPGLNPWQIWISESQERMTLAVPKNKWDEFRSLMESRGVHTALIGEFTNSGSCIVTSGGTIIMDMDMKFLHNGSPVRHLKTTPFQYTVPVASRSEKKSYTADLITLLKTPGLNSFKNISEQYDHEVQAGSVQKPLSGPGQINTDAQIIKPVLNSKKGIVLTSATFPSYSDYSAYNMAACAVDTAVRNAVAAGAPLGHLALLDNFCWCSAHDPSRLAQLVDAARACYDTAIAYGAPFVSGKDSMFNDFKGFDEGGNKVAISIPPTLLVSAIGVMQDTATSVSPEFKVAGDRIYILGETHDEPGAPRVDVAKNMKTYRALESAIKKGMIASALSVGQGGLALALAKASIGAQLGAKISFDKPALLFSESMGRIVVSVAPKNVRAFEKIMHRVVCTKLGSVTKNNVFIITDDRKNKVIDTTVKKLHAAYHTHTV